MNRILICLISCCTLTAVAMEKQEQQKAHEKSFLARMVEQHPVAVTAAAGVSGLVVGAVAGRRPTSRPHPVTMK